VCTLFILNITRLSIGSVNAGYGDPGGHTVEDVGLWQFACWGLRVRIPPVGMDVCCDCCVLSGRGGRDELITRLEKSYRAWSVWGWLKNIKETLAHWGWWVMRQRYIELGLVLRRSVLRRSVLRRFTFNEPCPVGPSTTDLWSVAVATQASFLYLVSFWLFSAMHVFLVFLF